MARPKKTPPIVAEASSAPAAAQAAPDNASAQAHALRIWEGQSPDLAVIERVARIARGLREQNMTLDIELPHPDAGRYLEAHK